MHAAMPPLRCRAPAAAAGTARAQTPAPPQLLRAALLAAACAAAHAQPGGRRGNRGGAIGIGVAIIVVIIACCVACCFRKQLRAWLDAQRRPVGSVATEAPPPQQASPFVVSGTLPPPSYAAAAPAPIAVVVVPSPLAAPADDAAIARARENMVQTASGIWVPREAVAGAAK